MSHSYVVTGGGRGVGRAIAERLAADGGTVVIIERDEAALDWVPGHPAAGRLSWMTGSAADERVAETAAERAEVAAPLAGWVNNAALFRDAALHTAEPAAIMDLISANLAPVVTGCAVAVRRFRPRPSTMGPNGSGSTPWRSARSTPSDTRHCSRARTRRPRRGPNSRWPSCTRSAGSARPRRSPTRWRTCCPTRPASSPG